MKLSIHEILKAHSEFPAKRPAPKTQWERILVPVDFSEHSREALKLAVSLAADPEDRITLLHIVAPESVLHRGNAVMMTLKKSDEELQAEAAIRLKRWASQEAGPDIEVETVVRTGHVVEETLRVAETRDCDLIVMATRPKGWIERLVTESMTKKLQRKAPCAVVCIRPAFAEVRTSIPVRFTPEQAWRTNSHATGRSVAADQTSSGKDHPCSS